MTSSRKPLKIYFDIDGVLNTWAAAGDRGCVVHKEKWDRLLHATREAHKVWPVELVCISYWRHWPERVQRALRGMAEFPFTHAPRGEKAAALDDDHSMYGVVIDDQPSYYDSTTDEVNLFATESSRGLTRTDNINFIAFIKSQGYRLHEREIVMQHVRQLSKNKPI